MRRTEEESHKIGILEPSAIVTEGLRIILLKAGHFNFYHIDHIDDIERYVLENNIQLIIINPSLVVNLHKEFTHIKRHCPNVVWGALVYSFFDAKTLSLFDFSIAVTDQADEIVGTIRSKLDNSNTNLTNTTEPLSDREIDVLKLLVQGLLNKEIADKLNISIHTVISHRKNITQKTGIKTQAGLTIYAISNKIISL